MYFGVAAWFGISSRSTAQTSTDLGRVVRDKFCTPSVNYRVAIAKNLDLVFRKFWPNAQRTVRNFRYAPNSYPFTAEMERSESGLHKEPYFCKNRPCNFFYHAFVQPEFRATPLWLRGVESKYFSTPRRYPSLLPGDQVSPEQVDVRMTDSRNRVCVRDF